MTFRERYFRSILIPKNLPKMTFRRHFRSLLITKNLPNTTNCRKKYIGQNLPKMTFQVFSVASGSQKSPQIDIFADAIISPNRQLFFWSIFPKKKKTITVNNNKTNKPQLAYVFLNKTHFPRYMCARQNKK